MDLRAHAVRRAAATPLIVLALLPVWLGDAGAQTPAAQCAPGGPAVEASGSLRPEDATQYAFVPFDVAAGTTRVEVGYGYSSNGPEAFNDKTVVDLGVWDEDGTTSVAGFRGWSGSRQGKVEDGQGPIWIDASSAERGYVPGPTNPGRWNVELGFGAVHSAGGSWRVTIRCLSTTSGPPWVPDPVDPALVARNEPGWYRADLHLHGYDSNPNGPDPAAMVAAARRAKLDIVPVTDYVTDAHWGRLGAAQRDNPDLLLFPGREVITYRGHLIVVGETPSTLEYRAGLPGVDVRAIEQAAVGDGALVQVAHPTIFPGQDLAAFCRGCAFRLGDQVDWGLVDTIEVVTGPVVIDPSTQERPTPGGQGIANPFVPTAIDLWESLLQQGYRITAVSGSDDKLGAAYGETATMIKAEQLSRAAVVDALRAGHAYVQTKGADASPTLDVEARTPDGQVATFGDTLTGTVASMAVTVQGAAGQSLVFSRDGTEVERRPIPTDSYSTTVELGRDPAEGPLGTFWRVDVADATSVTAVGNPVFLADRPPPAKLRGAVPATPVVMPNFPAASSPAAPGGSTPPSSSPRSTGTVAVVAGVVALAALALVAWRRRYGGASRE